MMIPSVVSVAQTGPYRLRLRFDDGADGEIDIRSTTTFEGVFEALNDPVFSRKSGWTKTRRDDRCGRTAPISIRSSFIQGYGSSDRAGFAAAEDWVAFRSSGSPAVNRPPNGLYMCYAWGAKRREIQTRAGG
jgi:hypothetical protein